MTSSNRSLQRRSPSASHLATSRGALVATLLLGSSATIGCTDTSPDTQSGAQQLEDAGIPPAARALLAAEEAGSRTAARRAETATTIGELQDEQVLDTYACPSNNVGMSGKTNLVRRSFFIDERELQRAKKVLGATSDAEAVRLSLEHVAEMAKFWALLDRTSGTLEASAFGDV